mgnify:CR=1 FL=1
MANRKSDNPQQQSFDLEQPADSAENSVNVVLQTDDEQIVVAVNEVIAPDSPNDKNQTNENRALENKTVVTPYAFQVSEHIIGEPLASPLKRLMAITIDLVLIGLLTTIGILFFAGFCAFTCYKASDRLALAQSFVWVRRLFRGLAASIVFVIAVLLAGIFDDSPSIELNDTERAAINYELLDLASAELESECQTDDLACLLEHAENIAIIAAAFTESTSRVESTLQDVLNQKSWDEATKQAYLEHFKQTLNEERNAYLVDNEASDVAQGLQNNSSLLTWVSNTLAELGLGLGWSALYFSVFTAWWNGQTVGKKLLAIKVVRIDGKVPSLWDSFGRYGGYGAGFATGLLGFLQILWDPNRQAIQDKISETLVVSHIARVERLK